MREDPAVVALMFAVRVWEFVFYSVLLRVVDRVHRLPRARRMPEVERLYRENLALKAQLDALEAFVCHLRPATKPKDLPLSVRAAQVFAWLITQGLPEFQQNFLSAPIATIRGWMHRLLHRDEATAKRGGRPTIAQEVMELIVRLRKENGAWGAKRIHQELRRLGVRVSIRSIRRILAEHGFAPHPGRPLNFDRVRSAAKDALWAMDYFAIRTVKGAFVQVLLVIDIFTRELMELKVHEGWDVDAVWTTRTFVEALRREKRTPKAVLHDHGTHFLGQFARQLRVLEIEDRLTPVGLPSLNCYAESAIAAVRRELLRYLRPDDAREAQAFMDDFRAYANGERAHQGLAGRTPRQVSTDQPRPDVLPLEELRRRRLVGTSRVRGLLRSYALVAGDDAPTDRLAA